MNTSIYKGNHAIFIFVLIPTLISLNEILHAELKQLLWFYRIESRPKPVIKNKRWIEN
jgi:hypothetical protein